MVEVARTRANFDTEFPGGRIIAEQKKLRGNVCAKVLNTKSLGTLIYANLHLWKRKGASEVTTGLKLAKLANFKPAKTPEKRELCQLCQLCQLFFNGSGGSQPPYLISKIASTSTAAFVGSCAKPKALLAWYPSVVFPKISCSKSEVPLITRCCSWNSSVEFTQPRTLITRSPFSVP